MRENGAAQPSEDGAMTTDSHFRQRRLILTASASYVVCSLLGLTARAGPAQNVLSIVYSGSLGLDPNVRNLAQNLQASGATVTSYWGPFPGDLAMLLQQTAFDQIFIWDMDSAAPEINAADKAALSAWWNASPSHRNIVLDSRSGGIFAENDASEQAYCKNVVANFANRGGGLWIGAKYAPIGARTANAYLDALASDANQPTAEHFEGTYANLSTVTGSSNPLLTTPNVVDAAGLAWNDLGEFGRSQAPASAPGIGALVTVATDAEVVPTSTRKR